MPSRTVITLLWITGTAAVTIPKAIAIEPSQYWDGNDGPWSSFPIRVGTPPQNVNVFVSTAATSTIVVGPSGCQGSGIPSNCTSLRGGVFDDSQSSSWSQIGIGNFGLSLENNLGFAADEGIFGYETVGLGYQGSGLPTLNHTTTAWIQTFDFLVGSLGLNPRPTNFTTFNDPQPSYLTLLYQQQYIASLTYGYTAGAQYMFNQVLGSLTLGGYDQALFVKNSVSFPFNFDQTRDLTVGLQGILTSDGANLLPKGILTLIDSTVPQIWLPLEACQAFESAFGLVYDTISGFYLVNETLHDNLLARSSNITFTLAPTLSSTSDQQIHIVLPYKAFDLTISYPWVANTTRYFPLRRASNSTQYTLGRTFLQEAYLIVDYQRSNFSISQRLWSESPNSQIISILPPGPVDYPLTSTFPKKFPTAAIAGIAVGAAAIIIGVALAIYLCLRRKRHRKEDEHASAALAARLAAEAENKQNIAQDPYATSETVHELISSIKDPSELQSAHSWSEVDGTPASERRFELGGPLSIDGRFELDAPHGQGELSGRKPVEINPLSPLTSLPSVPTLKLGTPSTVSPMTPEHGSWDPKLDAAEAKSLREIKEEPKSLQSMQHERARPFSWQLDENGTRL